MRTKDLAVQVERLGAQVRSLTERLDELERPPAPMVDGPPVQSVFAQKWDWLADHANTILKGGA